MIEHKAYAHVFYQFVCRFNSVGFVFVYDVAVESDAQFYARFFHYFLLLFILEKSRNVVVNFKAVQAVVVYVYLPEDIVVRHLFKEGVRIFSESAYESEHVGMRYSRGAAATFCVGKNIAVRRRAGGVVEVFYKAVIEKRNVCVIRQGVFFLAYQGVYFYAGQNFDFVFIFFFDKFNVVVIAQKSRSVIFVERRSFVVNHLRVGVDDPVVVVGKTEQFYSVGDCRFDDFFDFVVRVERVIRMRV